MPMQELDLNPHVDVMKELEDFVQPKKLTKA